MTVHAQPPFSTAPLTVQIAPGQILWACLSPGSVLHATKGEVLIHGACDIPGHAMPPHPQAVVKPGSPCPLTDSHRATWVQLASATRSPAEVKIVECAVPPGLRQKTWQFLQRAFLAARAKAPKHLAPGGLHTAP